MEYNKITESSERMDMKQRGKKIQIRLLILILTVVLGGIGSIRAEESTGLTLSSPSAMLMEASTGTVIYEKNADEQVSPASITKIMTAILIFDAIEEGRIGLNDEVTTSAYAKSMGGSQVFLEEGEKQTVETLIKCILVASGNDASVAMAEHISGSEEAFVAAMNERAAALGMSNTHFEDCCGLTDSDGHYTSARDVAIMSRELITRYPQVKKYTTIWMESITHVTNQGSSEFGLANTNKLLKQYEWTTGLKTGSTAKAKYCLSATAWKDGIEMIAVVMGCPDYRNRFPEAAAMLNYGYAGCRLYRDETPPELNPIAIANGVKNQAALTYGSTFTYLALNRENLEGIEKRIELQELKAPVEQGDPAGKLTYFLDGTELGSVEILVAESVKEAKYFDYWLRLWYDWLMTEKKMQ